MISCPQGDPMAKHQEAGTQREYNTYSITYLWK